MILTVLKIEILLVSCFSPEDHNLLIPARFDFRRILILYFFSLDSIWENTLFFCHAEKSAKPSFITAIFGVLLTPILNFDFAFATPEGGDTGDGGDGGDKVTDILFNALRNNGSIILVYSSGLSRDGSDH
jgi:hypothetical protein